VASAPRARTVYQDGLNRILDMDETPAEACLVLDWASTSVDPGEVVRKRANAGDGYLHGAGCITFEPTMPLRPGRYQATFEVEAGGELRASHCEVNRIFLDNQDPPQPDPQRAFVTLARAPLHDHVERLTFTVPDEKGPEPVLQFRVVHEGGGSFRVLPVRIAPAN
jgi:hypothetical protein